MLAAVGPMQLEVASWRLEHEFGAATDLSPTPYTIARRTDETSAPELAAMPGVRVLARADGVLYALFESPYWLARVEADHPELALDRLVAEGTAG
jgi:peptide chain release factor 3